MKLFKKNAKAKEKIYPYSAANHVEFVILPPAASTRVSNIVDFCKEAL